MPRIDPHQDQLKAYLRAARLSKTFQNDSENTVHKSSSSSSEDPLVLVYNIRERRLRKTRQSDILKEDTNTAPLLEMSMANPPLLVDGRMFNIDLPRWQRLIGFSWRTTDGRRTFVKHRMVKLPASIWMERNFQKKWQVLWIERA